MNELVSIIIPVYNCEVYIRDCLNSVLLQTYKNLEIIIIDDGSTDQSYRICCEIAERDKRIRVFSKQNGGLSDARNYGILKSNGKFIFFLDSDDEIAFDTIELMLKPLIGTNKMSICSFEEFNNTVSLNKRDYASYSEFSKQDYFISILSLHNKTFATGCLIPRSALNDIFFIKNRYFEDMATMYYIFDNCSSIVRFSNKFYKYRVNPNSILHTINKKKITDFLQSANEMIDYLMNRYYFDYNICNTFLTDVYRSCYIYCKDDAYLVLAKNTLKNSNLKYVGFKNKFKLLLLNSICLSKLFINFKK